MKRPRDVRFVQCAECPATARASGYVPGGGWSLRRDDARLCPACTDRHYRRLMAAPEACDG